MSVHCTTVGKIVAHSLHKIHKTTVRDRLCVKGKKNDNNVGEKDYAFLLFIFLVRFHEKRNNFVCDSRRLFSFILRAEPKTNNAPTLAG